MGFIQANKMFFKRYFDFEGRSSRSEMWWPFLLWWILAILTAVPAGIVSEIQGTSSADENPILMMPFVIFYFATLIPGIAVRVRRFHDQDRSGWMYLLRFIPIFGGLVIIILMCLEGTRGPNRFGPDPLGHDFGATFD